MDARNAVALMASAVEAHSGVWADLGAGAGTFTHALSQLLLPGSRVYAVDRDPAAVRALAGLQAPDDVTVVPVLADFTKPFDLPHLRGQPLDGVVFANALHFVKDAEGVLRRMAGHVRDGGRVVVIEYDRRSASRWVPYPLAPARLERVAAAAGLAEPRVTATAPSRYSGTIYVAVCRIRQAGRTVRKDPATRGVSGP